MAKTSILNWLKSTTRRSKRSSRRSSGSNSSTGGQRSINASSSSDGRISTKDKRSKTSDDDNSSIRRGHKDNGKVPESILLSQSEDEDENSTKSNSDKDKPLSPLKKFGFTDRAARELRKGMKEAGDKGGKNIKVGMQVAGEKVKEGMKEAGEKTGEKVKEGMKEAGEKVKEGMKEAAEKAGDKVKEGLKDISVDHKISADLKIITTSNRFIAVIELIAGLSFLSNIKYDIDDIRFFITSCLGAFLFWFCLYKNRV